MKKTLEDWLRWQETLHLSEIDLGLSRISKVAKKLDLLKPEFPVITVAGTNGKGSTVAFLDSILREEGYSTGAYTSPHLVDYNERITLSGKQASDELIISAFEEIDKARTSITNDKGVIEEISLTYFEFSTLAAMLIYQQQAVDVAILEVGLGGRLDAANLWDADLALITSIGIDHVDWLGDDREVIAVEKSGIMRKETPVVCGDHNPPSTIASEAKRIGAQLQQIEQDFSYSLSESQPQSWTLQSKESSKEFDLPSMQGEFQLNNAATAITGLRAIQSTLPVSHKAINDGLRKAKVMGRLQLIQKNPQWLIDVAHNPHAAKELAKYIEQNPIEGKTYALFSMLQDKDISEVIQTMTDVIDEWHLVSTPGPRGLSLNQLEKHFEQVFTKNQKQNTFEQSKPRKVLTNTTSYTNLNDACGALKNLAKDKDRVVAFGSFLVISEILDICN